MTQSFSDLRQEQIIEELYAVNDTTDDSVLMFHPPLCEMSEGLLDDVAALLSNPETKNIAEEKLRATLQDIAQTLL